MAKYSKDELALAIRRHVYEEGFEEEILIAVLDESTKAGLERAIDTMTAGDVTLADYMAGDDEDED